MTTETKVEAVTRYSLDVFINHRTMAPIAVSDRNGAYVLYDDHQSALDALRGEVSMLREALHIETHKVITCGVAASHPDASLSRRMEYAGKWDSPQAQEVRALRDKADAAERRVADAMSEINKSIKWREYECEELRNAAIKISTHLEHLRIHEACIRALSDVRKTLTKESP
jgi:hypothetical protein